MRTLALCAALMLMGPHARAQQQNPGFFMPPAAQQPRPGPARPARPPPPVQLPAQPQPGPEEQGAQALPPPPPVPLPPVPDLPALEKGAAPPVAVIGVLGIPDVMEKSTAGIQVQKIIGERRQKLNEDAQKEQAIWRDMQQALATDRTKLTPDQIRNRERELQDRVTNAQRVFRQRNETIQRAAQYAFGQIERSLIAVIRQVAESHGMNLVLHRTQVALNVNEFDITDQVREQLNKVLPTVMIPPDGVTVEDFIKTLPPAPPVAPAPPAASSAAPAAGGAAPKP